MSHERHHDQRHPDRGARRGRPAVGAAPAAGPAAVLADPARRSTTRSAPASTARAVSQFTLTARLPDGFFPVNNSAQATVRQPRTRRAPALRPCDAARSNGYHVDGQLSRRGHSIETATLTFDSWVGLNARNLHDPRHRDGRTPSRSPRRAPRHRPPEPGGAGSVDRDRDQADTLVAGHIAFGGEQAFYKVNLDGLPPGTRISAFLNVPSDADLDLTMSAPARRRSSPRPSARLRSARRRSRTGCRFLDGNGQTLSPDTLQDVPVGSTPVGSTPVGLDAGREHVGQPRRRRERGRRDHHRGPDRLRHRSASAATTAHRATSRSCCACRRRRRRRCPPARPGSQRLTVSTSRAGNAARDASMRRRRRSSSSTSSG